MLISKKISLRAFLAFSFPPKPVVYGPVVSPGVPFYVCPARRGVTTSPNLSFPSFSSRSFTFAISISSSFLSRSPPSLAINGVKEVELTKVAMCQCVSRSSTGRGKEKAEAKPSPVSPVACRSVGSFSRMTRRSQHNLSLFFSSQAPNR